MAQESWKRDQEETGCQPSEGSLLCTNGCGYFGSAATMSLCSKCYRDFVLKQAEATSAKAAEKSILAAMSTPQLDRSPETDAAGTPKTSELSKGKRPSLTAGVEEPEPTQNRCSTCRKRVGLTGFKCRCGHTFCALHRYADKHSCSFDYKKAGRDAIAKANPVVKADKIEKI